MLPLVRAGLLAGGLAILPCSAAHAVFFTPFGANGQGGAVNGQTFTIGSGGALHELDNFLVVDGQDLNGAENGVAAQLSKDTLPAGLSFSFETALQDGETDLALTYTITNAGGSAVGPLTFLSFVDFEIDEPANTFFDEFATANGVPASGVHWEADEPGFTFGNLFAHLQGGVLDDANNVPVGAPDDVAMALSFAIAGLAPSQAAVFKILLSEDGDSIGGFALEHGDADPASLTRITYSGALVPEPASALLVGAGVVALAARRRLAA